MTDAFLIQYFILHTLKKSYMHRFSFEGATSERCCVKAYVLKHTACAPSDITVFSSANQNTCAKAHRVCQPFSRLNHLITRFHLLLIYLVACLVLL